MLGMNIVYCSQRCYAMLGRYVINAVFSQQNQRLPGTIQCVHQRVRLSDRGEPVTATGQRPVQTRVDAVILSVIGDR